MRGATGWRRRRRRQERHRWNSGTALRPARPTRHGNPTHPTHPRMHRTRKANAPTAHRTTPPATGGSSTDWIRDGAQATGKPHSNGDVGGARHNHLVLLAMFGVGLKSTAAVQDVPSGLGFHQRRGIVVSLEPQEATAVPSNCTRTTTHHCHYASLQTVDRQSPSPQASCIIWFSTPHTSAKRASVRRFIGWGAASRTRQSNDFGWWQST